MVSKTHNTVHSRQNFPAGSRQAVRGARICETRLLESNLIILKKVPVVLTITLVIISIDADVPSSKIYGHIAYA